MSWRYGIVKREKVEPGEDQYGVHEIYPNSSTGDKSKRVTLWTESPVGPTGEDRNGIIWQLEAMLKDCKRYKTLDEAKQLDKQLGKQRKKK